MNLAVLVGNLTKDPELRYTSGGTPVCTFTVATSRSYKTKDTNEWKDVPTFHRIVCWNKLGEFCSERLKKGNHVTIEGRIENRQYEVNGEKKNISEIIADSVYFTSPKPNSTSIRVDAEPKVDEQVEDVDPSDIPF